MNLDEICDKLHTLIQIKGTNDKEKFLKEQCDTSEVKYLLTILLDSQYTLGLKKIGNIKTASSRTIRTFDELVSLINKCLNTNTNDKLRDEVVNFLIGCTPKTQDVLQKLLQKTLKIGCTAKTLNKVFSGIIPEHPIALAKSPTEAEIQLPCIVGTKYDGIRYTQCGVEVKNGIAINTSRALTRDRNTMRFSFIETGIKELLRGMPDGYYVVDGELETLDEDFDKIQGLVSSNIDSEQDDARCDIKLTVFDILTLDEFNGLKKSDIQVNRLLLLSKLFAKNNPRGLVEAEHITALTYDKVKEYTDDKIAKGLEGSIIKDPKAVYKKGKTSAWIKQKAINDCTLVCVGVTAGTNKRAGKIGALMMQSSDGLIKVNVGSGLKDEQVDLYTAKPPIGMFFDVLFNQVSQAEDLQMSLRLPRLKGLRTDVVEADSFDKIKAQHIGAMKLKGDKDED